ncbi:MAG: DEAD/DEAH box helicase [Myxococcales bacterium]|nr:DEAD/DEAH box helicase [Myxococcales bacterium]
MADETNSLADVPSPFREALVARGFADLTLVQKAVLEASVEGVDLRVSSQTGSGKTVALGLVLAKLFLSEGLTPGKIPFGIVIAPTRELAAQVAGELSWLFEGVSARVVVVTGGTSGGAERRELSRGATIVVGTPGRLLDHLRRGSLDATAVRAVVLDEADRMLDMGFTEDLEAILDAVPEGRRTHMVSATFPREVLRLADTYQSNVVDVEGTRRGDANADITHVVHIVPSADRPAAMINVLLSAPDEATLAFTKTREGASELAAFLVRAGFSASALTGDMEQSERTRALESFRSGRTRILAATDVAARGIDLPDVTRVIHADPPGDPESYTHRSGRTGRAGRKGTSVMFVPPAEKEKVRRLLRRAGIYANLLPIPSSESVREAQAERLVAELSEPEGEVVGAHAKMADRVVAALAGKVDPDTLVRRLLLRVLAGSAEPRELSAPARAVRAPELDERGGDRPDARPARAPRVADGERPSKLSAPARDAAPRTAFEAAGRPERMRAPKPSDEVDFVAFRVTWGSRHGADVRRLMAMSCRRGDVRGADLGAILVGPDTSIVEVRADVADDFERASKKPDPRDPRVRFARTEHGRDSRPGEAPSSPYLPVLEDEPRPRPRWVGGNTRPKHPGKRPPPRR